MMRLYKIISTLMTCFLCVDIPKLLLRMTSVDEIGSTPPYRILRLKGKDDGRHLFIFNDFIDDKRDIDDVGKENENIYTHTNIDRDPYTYKIGSYPLNKYMTHTVTKTSKTNTSK
eukprot:GHVR01182196.1.p1 GENE.GHVR01182196.1~~GHVR01182196.1.p1  ORF type:complete len:115 (+),score=20.72 GHVR01182196.1:74-418(+)